MTQDYDVAIVGAGAAGIAAARAVAAAGLRVVAIEADCRIGGRARTEAVTGLPLDLGCGWLHSAERNPFVALAEANGFAIDRTPSAWGTQYRDLGFPPAEQRAARDAWNAWHDRLEQDPPATDRAVDALDPTSRWNGYIEALSGYINATGTPRLSVADYLAYDARASETNWRVPDGYGTLVAALLPPVPIMLAAPVRAVDFGGGAVRLDTRAGTVTAKAAILTMSTAVLAAGRIRFTPAIDAHAHAAAQLPLGLADKIFLELSDGHGIEAEAHLLGDPQRGCTGSYYLRPFGRAVIEGFFGGVCAEHLEREGLAGAFAFAADELAALLGSGVRRRLRLLAGSAWRVADHVGGSYSHALPGSADCRALLARPVADRLFFAGEATDAHDYSTAHGAWASGQRAAAEAITALS